MLLHYLLLALSLFLDRSAIDALPQGSGDPEEEDTGPGSIQYAESNESSGEAGQYSVVGPSPRVIGGKEAREFPYYGFWDGCGSTLIAPAFALTAAHCFDDTRIATPIQFDGGRVLRNVTERRIHPQYELGGGFSPNDFMVVQLSEPITHITPIPLNSEPTNPSMGEFLRVVGRGFTDSNAVDVSPILMEAEVPFIPYSDCSAFFFSSSLVDEIMICSGGSGEVSCGGDSGGPILDSREKQVGVISWGALGCPDDVPSVAARVSAAFDWIQEQICDMEPTLCAANKPAPGPTPAPTALTGQEQSSSSCNDDSEAEFDVFGISRKCNWLARKVDQLVRSTRAYRRNVGEETLAMTWRQVLCNSGQDAYTYCEETCGGCQDTITCVDDDTVAAAFQDAQGRDRTCRWLRRRKPGAIRRHCRKNPDALRICQETCGNCP